MEYKMLKEVCSLSKGKQINGDELLDNGFPFYNGGINPSGYWKECNVQANSISISEGGNSCGYVNFQKEPFWCGAHCYYLYDLKIDTKYLYYNLKGLQNRIMALRTGVCMPNIKKSDIESFKVSIYDKNKQQEIVSILDKINAIIDADKKQLELLDESVKSRFIEMFEGKDYPVLKWNDVFNTTTGKLDSNAMVEGGQYPFFTCAKEVFAIDKYAFDQEALLLAGNNAAGKYDVKYYKGKFNAYQRTYVLDLKQNWSYQLFKYQLEDKLEWLREQSKGCNTRYITLKILAELEFIIPPIEMQNQFQLFVEQIDKSKFNIQQHLNLMQELLDKKMEEFFGGE